MTDASMAPRDDATKENHSPTAHVVASALPVSDHTMQSVVMHVLLAADQLRRIPYAGTVQQCQAVFQNHQIGWILDHFRQLPSFFKCLKESGALPATPFVQDEKFLVWIRDHEVESMDSSAMQRLPSNIRDFMTITHNCIAMMNAEKGIGAEASEEIFVLAFSEINKWLEQFGKFKSVNLFEAALMKHVAGIVFTLQYLQTLLTMVSFDDVKLPKSNYPILSAKQDCCLALAAWVNSLYTLYTVRSTFAKTSWFDGLMDGIEQTLTTLPPECIMPRLRDAVMSVAVDVKLIKLVPMPKRAADAYHSVSEESEDEFDDDEQEQSEEEDEEDEPLTNALNVEATTLLAKPKLVSIPTPSPISTPTTFSAPTRPKSLFQSAMTRTEPIAKPASRTSLVAAPPVTRRTGPPALADNLTTSSPPATGAFKVQLVKATPNPDEY